MLKNILSNNQAGILKSERMLLEKLLVTLVECEADNIDKALLQKTLYQLDELFLLVVAGEFNSGKSAFINALLGESVLPEGVTPTTDKITILRGTESIEHKTAEQGILEYRNPAKFLNEINIVDTPGTNAIIRHHEQLTNEFVPRSDMVIFVTSADRPFTESERAFLEKIRQWGKKVIIVLNKIDLLSDNEISEVVEYIKTNAVNMLGFSPEIFPVSARLAMSAKAGINAVSQKTSTSIWDKSRFEDLETYILKTLDEKSRIKLKLTNPLNIAQKLASKYLQNAGDKIDLLSDDLMVIKNIERQLELFKNDMKHDFRFRISDIENVILSMNNRGIVYFDETLRLGRIFDLLNSSKIQNEYVQQVVKDTPDRIESEVHELIDWIVERDLRQWQSTFDFLDEQLSKTRDNKGEFIGRTGSNFEYNRRALLDSVGRAAKEAIRSYDKEKEAQTLSKGFRGAVTGVAVVEAGAVSMGVLLVSILNTTLLDFTGILAAGSLAMIGLLILPAKKRKAKKNLADKLAGLKQRLIEDMTIEFDSQLNSNLQKMREAIEPYTRFVRSEQQKLSAIQSDLNTAGGELLGIIAEVEKI